MAQFVQLARKLQNTLHFSFRRCKQYLYARTKHKELVSRSIPRVDIPVDATNVCNTATSLRVKNLRIFPIRGRSPATLWLCNDVPTFHAAHFSKQIHFYPLHANFMTAHKITWAIIAAAGFKVFRFIGGNLHPSLFIVPIGKKINVWKRSFLKLLLNYSKLSIAQLHTSCAIVGDRNCCCRDACTRTPALRNAKYLINYYLSFNCTRSTNAHAERTRSLLVQKYSEHNGDDANLLNYNSFLTVINVCYKSMHYF